MTALTFAYVPSSHLDLFWLGSYRTCLERGADVIKQYLDRCLSTDDETFLLETAVFADYFLAKHPEYLSKVRELIRHGRLEVGAAYIDRWEHLILGESHIRNIQFGVRWSQERLGIENHLATHPDLPGLVPQTSQIYAQVGIRYYVTSRKLFPHGAVWRHVAPDGTSLLFLNWPRHYMYFPLDAADLPTQHDGWNTTAIDVGESAKCFPLDTIPINGSAADLTDPATFKGRYGAFLWDLVAANREKYPEYDFTYSIPSHVLEPYEGRDGLPMLRGEIPSVWGVACDETVAFFQRNREAEFQLLSAETMVVALRHLGLDWQPEGIESWQGTFYESAFYARKDPIPSDRALTELWRMHLFTSDHNGGGYEGALSSFQKRVMQDRVLTYTGDILRHGLGQIARHLDTPGQGLLLFNPGEEWCGPLLAIVPVEAWTAGLRPVDGEGNALPVQVDHEARTEAGQVALHIRLPNMPSVGYRLIPFARPTETLAPVSARVRDDGRQVTIATPAVAVTVNRETGAITGLHDVVRGIDWGHDRLANLTATPECGNDVTLRIAPDAPTTAATVHDMRVIAAGPLFTRVQIEKSLLGATATQFVTIWNDEPRVDVETRFRWWGAHNWQIRMALPTVHDWADIAYGTPFYGSAWTDVPSEAAPRNPDEILVEDYPHYREIQGWLHVRRPEAGLLTVTTHPGFHHEEQGLDAVLMRTSPSCGDPRFFWENAGEQIYRFSFVLTGADWRRSSPFAEARRLLQPPCAAFIDSAGGGALPARQSLLAIAGENVQLSSIAPSLDDETVDIRMFEASGREEAVRLSGPLIHGRQVASVDLIGRPTGSVMPDADVVRLVLPPWRIRTLRISRDVQSE